MTAELENGQENKHESVQRDIIFCKDILAFLDFIVQKRNLTQKNVELLKIGLDGGGGFFKVCLNIQTKETTNRGDLKDSGVKKLFILAIVKNIKENYFNVLYIWKLLKIDDLGSYSISTDLKLANILMGLMSHSSAFPCTWCQSNAQNLNNEGDLRTFENIRNQYLRWTASGSILKKAKHFFNCIHEPIPQKLGEPVILVIPPPELHLLLGETRINQENEDKKDDIREENISRKVITGDSEGGSNPDQASTSKFNSDVANVEVTKLNLNAQETTIVECNELNPFNTDRALFQDVLTDEMKRKIIISGPNRPMGPSVRNIHTNKSFSVEYYYTTTKTGQKIDRFCLPFRGHHENIYEIGPQSGNFLNIIDLLSRYDPLLKSHITNKNNRNKYLHHDTQNEIITLMSKSVVKEIVSEISKAPFFSLIVDTTQDISKKDQLSIIISHVKVDLDHDKSIAGKIEIKESFLRFIEIGKNFECVILSTLKELKIDIGKCRGQGYDGASKMSGKYSGLQARIKEKVPTADFIHCSAHNLNLVLNGSVQNVSEIRNFYGLLENMYLIFSKSLPRWQELNKSKEENAMIKKTLKRLCPTRWSSCLDCLSAIKYNYKCVMQCLSTFILICKKTSDRIEANSLQKSMSSYDFILLLVYQSKILENISLVSKLLQSSTVDLGRACELLSSTIDNFNTIRDDFEILHAEATNLATSWNIQPKLKSKRQRMDKTFFDELATDTGIEDSLRRFQIKVFYESLDIIINQLRTRFISMNKILINLLKPFEEITKIVSHSNCCISEVIPLVSTLEAYLNSEGSNFAGFGTMKDELKNNLKLRFKDATLKNYLLFATFLDPRFKGNFFTPNKCKIVIADLKREYEIIQNHDVEVVGSDKIDSSNENVSLATLILSTASATPPPSKKKKN
ncbi:unnamed protein product [Brassicogethes aeneus]|uniref:DUF4371 domain-containing protein n=1 Tax=Brassicogethes aeneus TaxID=1431903 RepID=A0A9P0FHV7_BRAAE|nr:unnamed protein product [Brassicogethes aeneus]